MLLAYVLSAHAVDAEVNITLPQEAIDAGMSEEELETELKSAIGDELHTVDLSGYLAEMADANVLSAKGMGVDYGSDMQRFAFGGAFGTAVSGAGAALDGGTATGLPETGFALQIGVMAGLNLGAFSEKESALRRFKLYVNGMSAETDRDPFSATFLNYGAHAQIKMIKGGDKTDGIRWGGLDLTTGYEYSSYTLALEQSMPVSTNGMTWDATGTYTMSAEAESLPVELSTNLHVFVVTVFLGGAFDYNLSGGADSKIAVGGPISFKYGSVDEDVGSATLSLSENGDVSEWKARGFVGAQADIFFLKVYGQLNVTTDKSLGGHVGIRAVL
ncbi:hypothetical protein LBMAG42_40320 [Deltaproteobacteria bacterium]|nr:hypothetical protein LBMAG42_40320 [Deltaproteobacteria bacterium]